MYGIDAYRIAARQCDCLLFWMRLTCVDDQSLDAALDGSFGSSAIWSWSVTSLAIVGCRFLTTSTMNPQVKPGQINHQQTEKCESKKWFLAVGKLPWPPSSGVIEDYLLSRLVKTKKLRLKIICILSETIVWSLKITFCQTLDLHNKQSVWWCLFPNWSMSTVSAYTHDCGFVSKVSNHHLGLGAGILTCDKQKLSRT